MSCKIALVDSGIDLNLYKDNLIKTIDFIEDRDVESDSVSDKNSHGTLCCSAVLSINPIVKIWDVKVLDKSNKCTSKRLIAALDYLTQIDVNIISLSLATNATEHIDEYKGKIAKLKAQGKIIIASYANDHSVSLPAILSDVIGVNGNMFINDEDFWYNKHLQIQCVADKKAVLLKGLNGEYELFGGNSKATAIFTGFASRFFDSSIKEDIENLENIFMHNAKKNEWDSVEDEMPQNSAPAFDKDVPDKFEQLVLDMLNIPSQGKQVLYEKELYTLGLTKKNCINIIKEIEKHFNVDIEYNKVNIYWFYSLRSLHYNIFRR